MTDSTIHFRNEVIRLLAHGPKCRDDFTQAYCPWSNGAIARLGKEILRVCCALISVPKLRVDSWPNPIPIIQSVINHSPSPQQNNIAPVTVFTGLKPSTPIDTFIRLDKSVVVTVIEARPERSVSTNNLISHMEKLHPLIHDAGRENRKRAREHISKGRLPNF